DEVVVALRLGDLDVAEGALDHRRRAGVAVLLDQLALQATGVDADAHGQALVLGLADDLAVAVVAADVAGVDADLVDGVVHRRQGHLVVEVDVADERNLDLPPDLAQHGGVFGLGHGDADDLAAGFFEAADFGEDGVEL